MNDPSAPGDPASLPRRAASSSRSHPWFSLVLFVIAAVSLTVSSLIGLPIVVTLALAGIVAVGAFVSWWFWASHQPGRATLSSATAGRMGMGAVALSGLITFAVIQLVPCGRAHPNPPVTGEPAWATARTRELMVNACFSCHSNEVEYPAYASVAPISWLVQRHIEEGRDKVNYSEFAANPGEAEESIEIIDDGEMPPGYFTRFGLHPTTDLTSAETAELIDGFRNTPGLAGE